MQHIALSRSADHNSEFHGDLEDAIEQFDRALALEPNHVDALWQRGLALASLGKPEAALESLSAVLRHRPDDANVHFAMARAFEQRELPEAALASYQRVLELRPDDVDAQYGKAEMLTQLGRDEDAVAAWDVVLSMDYHRFLIASPKLSRASCLAWLGRAEAYGAFVEALADDAHRSFLNDPPLVQALRKYEVARKAYASVLATKQAEPAAWSRAGKDWLRAGLPRKALEAYDILVGKTPNDPHAWCGKADVHRQLDELDASIAAYRKALELWPEFTAAAVGLCDAEEQMRKRSAPASGIEPSRKCGTQAPDAKPRQPEPTHARDVVPDVRRAPRAR